jgi:GNAT superfamily N-acetyltransferase
VTVVRALEPGDLLVVAELLLEMDAHYKQGAGETVATKVANLREHLLGAVPSGYLLIAAEDGVPVGFAAYSFLWPAGGSSRGMFLKDLYVAAAHRGGGVGRVLMDALLAVAREAGCSRVDWTADVGNLAAQRLYESLGATRLETKVFYRRPL